MRHVTGKHLLEVARPHVQLCRSLEAIAKTRTELVIVSRFHRWEIRIAGCLWQFPDYADFTTGITPTRRFSPSPKLVT
jgi:hypothetical protein